MRFAPLFLLVLLSACTRTQDLTPPLLGVTSPPGGVVARGRSLSVEGYALDDGGVQSVRVSSAQGERELLAADERGKKLVSFKFRLEAPQSGQVELTLSATNTAGLTRTLKLPLLLDARPPVIKIERLEPVYETRTRSRQVEVTKPADPNDPTSAPQTVQETRTESFQVQTGIRITGKVYDDTGVDRVALEYGGRFSPLSLPKGKDVPFFVEVPAKSATVIAVDAAGNRASRDVP